jgi:hypothetical protein
MKIEKKYKGRVNPPKLYKYSAIRGPMAIPHPHENSMMPTTFAMLSLKQVAMME